MKRHSTRLDALEKRLTPREPVFLPRTAEDDAAWLRSMVAFRDAFNGREGPSYSSPDRVGNNYGIRPLNGWPVKDYTTEEVIASLTAWAKEYANDRSHQR